MGRDGQRTKLTREQLYTQVWAEPMTKVAQRYALSDRGLAKICQRMGVPIPGRGYWAKVQSGHVPLQPKLPKIKAAQDAKVVLDRRGFVLEEKETLQEVAGLIESEMHPENQIVVADELTDPHPLVVKTAKSLRGARLNDYGIARPRLKGCLDIRVGKASIERAARIMDALIKALDARGIELVRRREILIQRIEQEQGRVDALAKQTKAWQEAQELRAFVQAVRSAAYYPRRTITVGRDIDEWCAWALEQANRIDPTVSSPPSVLDHKKEYFLLR